jgi:hypothetical protein
MTFHDPQNSRLPPSAPSYVKNPGGGPVGLGCGLLLGAFIGAVWWGQTDTHTLWLVLPALVFGVLGGWRGDRFWHWVLPKLPWIT